MNTRVLLFCPDCPRGGEVFGDVDFPGGIPPLFIFRCKRGHALGIRPLSRDERRDFERQHHGEPAPPTVATRWEVAE